MKNGITLITKAVACLLFSLSAQAAFIDFTSIEWAAANGQSNYSVGGVTLEASFGSTLTFNGSNSERGGCSTASGIHSANLACFGDGIGLNNDEITGNQRQSLTVSFASPVDIIEIEFLDLFPNEGGQGNHEVAIIDGAHVFSNTSFSTGGYLATGYSANGVSSIQFTAQNDNWSDYALARIITSVPEPSSIALLTLGFIGLIAARRISGSQL